jgi:hypothetical protein
MLQFIAVILLYLVLLFGAGPFFQDAGKAIVTNLVSGIGGTVPKYVGIGTGAGPSDSTATALSTEVETRSGTNSPTRVTTTVTNDTFQVVQTISITATRAITEVGLFDASSSGNALILSGITTNNLSNGDSFQLTFKLKFA